MHSNGPGVYETQYDPENKSASLWGKLLIVVHSSHMDVLRSPHPPRELIAASWVKNMEIRLHNHGPDTYMQANSQTHKIKSGFIIF